MAQRVETDFGFSAGAEQLSSEVGPLRAALSAQQADSESARREAESARKEAGRWQQRVQQLLDKYKAIDVEEYQRLQDELMRVKVRRGTLGWSWGDGSKQMHVVELFDS